MKKSSLPNLKAEQVFNLLKDHLRSYFQTLEGETKRQANALWAQEEQFFQSVLGSSSYEEIETLHTKAIGYQDRLQELMEAQTFKDLYTIAAGRANLLDEDLFHFIIGAMVADWEDHHRSRGLEFALEMASTEKISKTFG